MNNNFLIKSFSFLFLLTACRSVASAPVPIEVDNGFSITAAATQTILPSPSIPSTDVKNINLTQTLSPTGIWLIHPPNNQKKNNTLYQLEFDPSKWKIINDPSERFFYGNIRNEQYLWFKVYPGCAIIHTVDAKILSSYPRDQFLWLIYSMSLDFDNSHYNIFIAGMDTHPDCLVSGKQVLSTLKKINADVITPTP